jgi:hypothetical protein
MCARVCARVCACVCLRVCARECMRVQEFVCRKKLGDSVGDVYKEQGSGYVGTANGYEQQLTDKIRLKALLAFNCRAHTHCRWRRIKAVHVCIRQAALHQHVHNTNTYTQNLVPLTGAHSTK